MRVFVFSTRPYDRDALEKANGGQHELTFSPVSLDEQTAALAKGYEAVCLFVNDRADVGTLAKLAEGGVRMIAQRSTGFNNIDLEAAHRHGIKAFRVGYYSPYAVAEHAVALLQTLNRRTHRAFNRVRENNFLLDGLVGRDIHGRTVGILGTGKIGTVFARIMKGFGCTLLGYDVAPNPQCLELGVSYVPVEELAARADILSLHLPLTPETHHIINADVLNRTKPGVFLINTSRGKLIDTDALIDALRTGHIGAVGLDVYEEEESLFFRDFSQDYVRDDRFTRLLSFPSVLVTAHQAFLTEEALATIARTTLQNLSDFAENRDNENLLPPR
ncbi:MAG: 2-hydroxyacid dehydrogenase [Capsulimonadales bacterium]|nr:2-hydroxyacid dehydrogenase [Capsulimonadales bacterium]